MFLKTSFFLACCALVAAMSCGDDDDVSEMPSSTAIESPTEEESSTPFTTSTRDETPSLSPTSTTTPTEVGDPEQAEPSSRDLADRLQILAGDIAERPAGSPQEQEAADYIEAELESFGYSVEQQSFEVAAFLDDRSRVSAEGQDYQAFAMQGSAEGEVEGILVAGGIGKPEELPREVAGNIALIERGELTFAEKVDNAQSAGARGVIIFNSEAGPLFGALNGDASIPVVAVSGLDGGGLLDAADAGQAAHLIVEGSPASESQNVIGRMGDEPCRYIVGGHYDTVPFAPGGQDNGSGTTAMIETAETLAAAGAARGVCFIAFGAEEIGLIGSVYYVDQLSPADAGAIEAVFNLDTVGFGDELRVGGDSSVEDLILRMGSDVGVAVERGQLGPGASSDHAPFLNAEIAAIILFTADTGPIHTPEDTVDIVNVDTLEEAVRLVVAAIADLRGEGF